MSIFYTQKQALKYLNITRMTILRWEEKGLITPKKMESGHRRYLKSDLDRLIGLKNEEIGQNNNKKCFLYARVSTKKQADSGNLERQIKRLVEYSDQNGFKVEKIYSEIGSGINENRKQLQKMLNDISKSNVECIIIEYKDRLARFGYNYIEQFCKSHGVTIIKVEQQEEKDLNEEMVQDMISIITSFSARLYGRRGAKEIKKQIKELSK